MKKIQLRKLTWIDMILLIIVAVQVIFIIYENAFRMPLTMDNDAAKSMVHAIEMWNTKSVHIANWSAMTGLETGDPAIFAVLFYGIFHNIYIAFLFADTIVMALYITVFVCLCKKMSINTTGTLISLALMFIPYTSGQLLYINMMFFSAASCAFRVLIPLLIILLLSDNSSGLKFYIPLLVITCLLIFVNAISTGIYIFIVAIIPTVFVYIWMEICRKKNIFHDFFTRANISVIAIILTFIAGIYTYYSMHFLSSGVESQLLIDFTSALKSIDFMVTGWFEILGGLPHDAKALISFSNLAYLLRMIITVFSIVTFLVYCPKGVKALFKNKQEDSKEYITAMLIVSSLVTILMCYVSGTGNQCRYLILPILASFIFIGDCVSQLLSSQNLSKIQTLLVNLCAIVAITLAALFSDYSMYRCECLPEQASYNESLMALKDVLYQYPEQIVVFLEDKASAEHLRLFDHDGDKTYLSFIVNADEWNGTGVIVKDYYTDITDAVRMGNSNLLVVNNELASYDILPDYIRDTYTEIDSCRYFTIYSTSDNKMDGIIGYEVNEHSKDYCYSDGYIIYSGSIDSKGRLVAEGLGDYVLASPMLGDAKGTLSIKMNYSSETDSDNIGTMEIWDAHTHEKVTEKTINGNENNILISDICLDYKNLVVKILINNDCNIAIEDFEYDR